MITAIKHFRKIFFFRKIYQGFKYSSDSEDARAIPGF